MTSKEVICEYCVSLFSPKWSDWGLSSFFLWFICLWYHFLQCIVSFLVVLFDSSGEALPNFCLIFQIGGTCDSKLLYNIPAWAKWICATFKLVVHAFEGSFDACQMIVCLPHQSSYVMSSYIWHDVNPRSLSLHNICNMFRMTNPICPVYSLSCLHCLAFLGLKFISIMADHCFTLPVFPLFWVHVTMFLSAFGCRNLYWFSYVW